MAIDTKMFQIIDNWVFIGMIISGDYPNKIAGSDKQGWTLQVSYVIELRNDSIFKVRDYWDLPGK